MRACTSRFISVIGYILFYEDFDGFVAGYYDVEAGGETVETGSCTVDAVNLSAFGSYDVVALYVYAIENVDSLNACALVQSHDEVFNLPGISTLICGTVLECHLDLLACIVSQVDVTTVGKSPSACLGPFRY